MGEELFIERKFREIVVFMGEELFIERKFREIVVLIPKLDDKKLVLLNNLINKTLTERFLGER